MVPAIRIGHLTIETPDIQRQIEYYTNVVGLVLVESSPGKAYLATRVGQLAVELNSGGDARCTRVSIEVSPTLSARDISLGLEKSGIASKRSTEPFIGVAEAVSFLDNKGTTIDLFTSGRFISSNQPTIGVGPTKLGHVAFAVQSPQETADFFAGTLGFRVSDWIGDFFVFQRCNADHHTLNFIKADKPALAHFAFELRDFAHLQSACDILGANKITLTRGPLRHGPGHNVALYHQTPDGLVLEFFCEMDRMSNEELGFFDPKPWHRDFPQRPKIWTRENNGTVIWGIRLPH